ncbi:wiskott-Aldrich syndrome protein homolog 1-like isoform X2 [Notothenia coriiceps]|uniref:Wiskott-Aldrich syndrome protein homolog 1-like isoform X2 n=1 Tax=Notothenia coriiceps TaxID=8208 RepID=A0A6I9N0H9_9TELE|nr:PREDICTED: wiskott-Aldrich syndrome protein homolog 1-like isoform X2 [Notothenia coriiceps]
MSAVWREEDEEFKVGGAKGGLRSKPRFSFTEVKVLLEAVKRNRFILLRKFNQGVSAEAKKQTWTEITNQINGLGENHREVRQIMKKWADLKCDGKRRALALRSPNGNNMRKKNLGPIERMVYKILIMSPRAGGDSDLEMGEDEDFSKLYSKGPAPNTTTYSYLSLTDSSHSVPGGGASFDLSPLSSPEKDLDGNPFHMSSDLDMGDAGEYALDFEENDDSMFFLPQPPPSASLTSLDPLPDNALLRMKPVHTYSRNSQSNTTSPKPPPPVPFFSGASTSSVIPSASGSETASSAAAHPPSQPLISSTITFSLPVPSSLFALPPPPSSSKVSKPAPSIAPPPASSVAYIAPSSSILPPSISSANRDPLPAGGAPRRTHDAVAQMASQGLEQQRASRMLLSSVSQSLEVLAQSVQLLVESQQEFVQDSLQLQRETVDILRDFSNTAITMLRDKTTNHPPAPRF